MERERFASLMAPHTGIMLRAAAALIGPPDAEDAVQEALLHAWRGWGALRDEAAARAWLLRITANVCRNWQAGHYGTHRRQTVPLDGAGGADRFPAGDPLDQPMGAAEDAMARSGPGTSDHASALDLRRAVARLDLDLRQVVALRYYAGMDATEIGAMLDLPPATVRTRLRRALLHLRERLAAPASPAEPADGLPATPAHERGR